MRTATSIPKGREISMSDSRLKMYARTASGAAALAAAGAANADIITSTGPTTITKNAGSVTLFAVGGVAVKANNLFRTYNGGSSGSASASFVVSSGSITNVNNSYQILPGFGGGTNSLVAYLSYTFPYEPNISSNDLELGANKLVGVSIDTGGGNTYYGWIDYSLSVSTYEFIFTINSWAYNDVAGEGIIAGQNTAAGSNAVPGLGGLAALAIGAAGVRSRRQRTVA